MQGMESSLLEQESNVVIWKVNKKKKEATVISIPIKNRHLPFFILCSKRKVKVQLKLEEEIYNMMSILTGA